MDEHIHEEISPIVIDLGVSTNSEINELTTLQKLAITAPEMLGSWLTSIMGAMFGGPSMPVTVRGTPSQVSTFAKTLQKEKRYIENYNKYGLNDPKTYRSKAELKDAVGKFERATGIKWPFK